MPIMLVRGENYRRAAGVGFDSGSRMDEIHVFAASEWAQMSFCHAATPGATTQALAEMDMADRLDLSVVAPCYNEALGLAEFHRRGSGRLKQTGGARPRRI